MFFIVSLNAEPKEKKPYPFELMEASIFLFFILYIGSEILSTNTTVFNISVDSFFISLMLEEI